MFGMKNIVELFIRAVAPPKRMKLFQQRLKLPNSLLLSSPELIGTFYKFDILIFRKGIVVSNLYEHKEDSYTPIADNYKRHFKYVLMVLILNC